MEKIRDVLEEYEIFITLANFLVAVVAIFIGTNAQNKISKLKIKKELNDNSTDNSINVGGDYINNSSDTTAIVSITSDNFKASLEFAQQALNKQYEENLKKIIEETSKIIKENKIEIGNYNKIDWINIYLESAKNFSNKYMQNVWARVLAYEIANPDSISYKTISTLKDMSEKEFKLFEKMCKLSSEEYLLKTNKNNLYGKYGIEWTDILILKEFGLLSDETSELTVKLGKNQAYEEEYQDFLLIVKNENEKEEEYCIDVHTFTSVSSELRKILNIEYEEDFLIDYVKEINENFNTKSLKMILVKRANEKEGKYIELFSSKENKD